VNDCELLAIQQRDAQQFMNSCCVLLHAASVVMSCVVFCELRRAGFGGLMNHLYAKLSEQQPMLLPILELESDPSCFML
jgi:hypothetical protein